MFDASLKIRAVYISQPHSMRPAHLIAIARTNAAKRCSDAFSASRLVEDLVLRNVPRKNDVRPVAELQVAAHFNSLSEQRVDFLQNRRRIDHHAGRNDV